MQFYAAIFNFRFPIFRFLVDVVGVCGTVEGGEPLGDVVADVAYVVEEGAEALFGYLALVEREGFDLVVPRAHGAVDGEVLRREVVVEEVPVVFGGFDIELELLIAFLHIELCLDVDGDTQRGTADTH